MRIPKTCSTCVKMISTYCKLRTTQEATYLTDMKLMCVNIAHIHKTRTKSQDIYRLYTKNKYGLKIIVVFCEWRLGYTFTIFADTTMKRFPLETFFFTIINTSDLIHAASIVSGNTLSDLQLLLSSCTDKSTDILCRILAHRILV